MFFKLQSLEEGKLFEMKCVGSAFRLTKVTIEKPFEATFESLIIDECEQLLTQVPAILFSETSFMTHQLFPPSHIGGSIKLKFSEGVEGVWLSGDLLGPVSGLEGLVCSIFGGFKR